MPSCHRRPTYTFSTVEGVWRGSKGKSQVLEPFQSQSPKTRRRRVRVEAVSQSCCGVDISVVQAFIPCGGDILSRCGRLVCEWEHLVGQRECVFVNRCVYTMTQTPPTPLPNLWYMKPPVQVTSVGSFNTGVQRAPRLATSGDPLPVLSPFNDWISWRMPSSRVIA